MPYSGKTDTSGWQIHDCPVCKRGDAKLAPDEIDGQHRFRCWRCGEYVLDSEYEAYLWNFTGVNDLLSGAIRHECEADHTLPVLDRSKAEQFVDRAPTSVPQKARGLLHYIASMSRCPGDAVWLDPEADLAVVYATNAQELTFFSDHLRKVRWIEDYRNDNMRSNGRGCVLTTEGWTEVEADRTQRVDSSQGFVAMSFDAKMGDVYNEAIKPAIESAGFTPEIINRRQFVGQIVDEILAQIRKSRFVVADFTGQKAGVYFEAGFAMGLGLPVIWTCEKKEIKKLHFDTSHYNHIVWEKPDDLRSQLKFRILAVIGSGPNAPKD